MWASRPPLRQHGVNVGDSPSLAATQGQCGRVAHTPIAVHGSNKPPHHGPVASQMKRSVVSIETFPLIGDEPFFWTHACNYIGRIV